MSQRQAHLVVDLGFGDSGKGTVVDTLVRQSGATMVVRFHGGAQAGHTVVLPDGRHHVFSQFGAGTLVPGVQTYLSPSMLVHPGGLQAEANRLETLGIAQPFLRLIIDPQALLITPFHQAANRLREILRGEQRHGSCGLGVGETASDALDFPQEAIRAGDRGLDETVEGRLASCQQRKWALFSEHRRDLRQHPEAAPELALLESAEAGRVWWAATQDLLRQTRIETPPWPEVVVFEGAQGVLLDEWRGFHPHTTWSTCTFDNAEKLLAGWDGEVTRWGVLRAYATRHGAGPFPTEEPALRGLREPHNATGPWQGEFRRGWLDLALARYARDCCRGLDALALTHLDSVAPGWKIGLGYSNEEPEFWPGGTIRLGPWQDLEYQERLGLALRQAQPIFEETAPTGLIARLEERLEAPVALESWGPTWQDKRGSFHGRRPSVASL